MIRAVDAALYILSLDKNHELFNNTLRTQNGRNFYEGNTRLNIYLHLAQNIYVAQHSEPLMDSVFFAYENGAVDPKVQENYSILLERRERKATLAENERKFLDAIYKAFQNASLDELIGLSREDSEWIDKHSFWQKEKRRMDSMAHKEEYAEQYADMIKVLERMDKCTVHPIV